MSTDIGLAVLLAKLNQMGSGGGSSTPVGAMMDFAASVTTIPDKWAPCNGDTLTRGILRGKENGSYTYYPEAAAVFPYDASFITSLTQSTLPDLAGASLQMTTGYITTSDGCVLSWNPDTSAFVREPVIPVTHKWIAFGCKAYNASPRAKYALSSFYDSSTQVDRLHFWRTQAPSHTVWEEVTYGAGTTWGDAGKGSPYYGGEHKAMSDSDRNSDSQLLFLAASGTYSYPDSVWRWDGTNPPALHYSNSNWLPSNRILPHSHTICDETKYIDFTNYGSEPTPISYQLQDQKGATVESSNIQDPFFIDASAMATREGFYYRTDTSSSSVPLIDNNYSCSALGGINDFYSIPYEDCVMLFGRNFQEDSVHHKYGAAMWVSSSLGTWEITTPLFDYLTQIVGVYYYNGNDYFLLAKYRNETTGSDEDRVYKFVFNKGTLRSIFLPTIPPVNGVQKLVYVGKGVHRYIQEG
jgi:hypothetical protein